MFGEGGASPQLLRPFIFPVKTLGPGAGEPCQWSLSAQMRHGSGGQLVTWPRAPFPLHKPEGTSPTSAAGRGRAGPRHLPARRPRSRARPREAHFSTWPLFPAWRAPGDRQGREEGRGGSGDLEAGSKRGVSDCSLLPTPRPRPRGAQPPCRVDMKRTLSRSWSW